jgi:hypothetical protein
MKPFRKTSLVFGLFFAGTFIFSIPALFFYDPLFNDKDYLFIGGFDMRISMGALFEILLAICNIATAIVIYPMFRRVSESVSLGYVAVRGVESVMILTGVISLMSVMTFRSDFIPGNDTNDLFMMSRMFIVFHDWTFLLGPQFCAGFGNGILLGYLMYRSGAVPSKLALIGLIGGPLAFIGGVLVLFGILEPLSPGLFALTALEIIWELSITFYAIFIGFRHSPVLITRDESALTAD